MCADDSMCADYVVVLRLVYSETVSPDCRFGCYTTRHLHIAIFTMFYFLVDEELRLLRKKIQQDYNDVSIRTLMCPSNFFKIDERFCTMVSRMTEIKCSRIFGKLWPKYGEQLQNQTVTVKIIFHEVWLRIYHELNTESQQFLSGQMRLKDIDQYLKMFDLDYEALEKEFVLLSGFFSDKTTHLDQVKKRLRKTIERVKNYKKLFDARDAAETILGLRKKVALKGDFSAVENLKQVRLLLFCACFRYFNSKKLKLA